MWKPDGINETEMDGDNDKNNIITPPANKFGVPSDSQRGAPVYDDGLYSSDNNDLFNPNGMTPMNNYSYNNFKRFNKQNKGVLMYPKSKKIMKKGTRIIGSQHGLDGDRDADEDITDFDDKINNKYINDNNNIIISNKINNNITNNNRVLGNIPRYQRRKVKRITITCPVLCDMENAFEMIDIIILLLFIIFVFVWWLDKNDNTLILVLSTLNVIFTLLVLNMRRSQTQLRWIELHNTVNDFRIVMFWIGLLMMISSEAIFYSISNTTNQAETKQDWLWISHSLIWISTSGSLTTIDFAQYMSSFIRVIYSFFIFIATILELSAIIEHLQGNNYYYNHNSTWYSNTNKILINVNNRVYTVDDLKIDGLLLMIIVQISALYSLIIDSKIQYYCFGKSIISRSTHLNKKKSKHQKQTTTNAEPNSTTTNNKNNSNNNNNIQSISKHKGKHKKRLTKNKQLTINKINRQIIEEKKINDYLLMIWIVNIAMFCYLMFFAWNFKSPYKLIPLCVIIILLGYLFYHNCDLKLLPLLFKSIQFVYLFYGLILLWFVSIYLIFTILESHEYTGMLSIFANTIGLTILSLTVVLIDIFYLTSNYFIVRGTFTIVLILTSLFNIWYITFTNADICQINWNIAILARHYSYIIIVIGVMSLFAWFRDSNHEYFIYIQHRRKKYNRSHLTRRDYAAFISNQTKNMSNPSTPVVHHRAKTHVSYKNVYNYH